MANCISYDCQDALGDYVSNSCGEELLAGISGMVLLECNNQLTDPSNATQINAEIAAGRAVLVDGIKVGFDAPSPVQVESNTVGATQKTVTYNRQGTLIDGNVSIINTAFYDKVFGGRVFGAAIMYIKGTEDSTDGAKVAFIDAPINFTGGLPIKNNNDENMIYTGTFTWRKLTMPTLAAAPVGIFA
jgi:hypothetical protein